MPKNPDLPPVHQPSLQEEVVAGVLLQGYSLKIARLPSDYAAFVRGTLTKRKELDQHHAAPGDAYLQAIADLGTYLLQLEAARQAIAALDVHDLPAVD